MLSGKNGHRQDCALTWCTIRNGYWSLSCTKSFIMVGHHCLCTKNYWSWPATIVVHKQWFIMVAVVSWQLFVHKNGCQPVSIILCAQTMPTIINHFCGQKRSPTLFMHNNICWCLLMVADLCMCTMMFLCAWSRLPTILAPCYVSVPYKWLATIMGLSPTIIRPKKQHCAPI